MGIAWYSFVIIKPHTTPLHYHLWCGAVIPFGWFVCGLERFGEHP